MIPNRNATLQRLQQLDSQRDHLEICHWLVGYEFPWDITRSLELALLRTFCIPSIAEVLNRTGEFRHHAQKRYDDTGIVVSELFKWGYHSPRGQAALQRMNAIHRHFPIRNDDYCYVLSTFVLEPVRWCERYGWRSLSSTEIHACFYFWHAIGQQMGIPDLPSTYDDLDYFNREYERQHFRFADSNQQVANATRRMLLSWFPLGVRSLINPAIPALLDAPMLTALGWSPAPAPLPQLVRSLLILRSQVQRHLPPRRSPDFFVDQAIRSYPQGYDISDVGPPALLERLNQQNQQDTSG